MISSLSRSIALDKTRSVLGIVRKEWNYEVDGDSRPGPALVSELVTLQNQLRGSSTVPIDPLQVLVPYLSLLKSPILSGPFKLLALDAIQTFANNNVFLEMPSNTSGAISEIIDAITNCKFVQTDISGDELVQLQIIETLHCFLKDPIKQYLTSETAWMIVESLHNLLLRAGVSYKGSLYQAAEHAVLDAVKFVFQSQVLYPTTSENKVNVDSDDRFACALKVFRYFINILQKHAREDGVPKPILARSSSGSLRPANIGLGNTALDANTIELVLALKVIHAIVIVDGDILNKQRMLLSCDSLSSILRDDLGQYLMMLIRKRNNPSVVIQGVLSIFGSLFVTMGPVLRVLIECFMKHVYLKALHQSLGILRDAAVGMQAIHAGNDLPHSPRELQNDKKQTSGSRSYTLSELETICESLEDLVSDQGFLPTLFLSFDCDSGKTDVVQPLIRYLSLCVRHTLTLPDRTEVLYLRNLSSSCMTCYSQVLATLSKRCKDFPSKRQNPTTGSIMDHIADSRKSKMILAQASEEFGKRPEFGIRYLQEQGLLSVPVTPSAVARFLRIAPNLPIECTGGYLGELGKSDPKHECDTIDFHAAVLKEYVKSFDFTGQTLLDSVRIFLSAFLLPKEAQQIDRVFVALSEHLHKSCVECRSGTLENADVTYLMTVSIIFLNTDRHNENIRADRKMTVDQFVKVNANYGQDVKQTRDISREYLEEIFNSINDYPLRTERNDISGEVTVEMWLDLQLQLTQYPERGFLTTTSSTQDHLNDLSNAFASPHTQYKDIRSVGKDFLFSNIRVNPLQTSIDVNGEFGAIDAEIIACTWPDFLGAGISPFMAARLPRVRVRNQGIHGGLDITPRTLQAGIEVLLIVLQLSHAHNLSSVVDTVVLLLADFAGMSNGLVVENIINRIPSEFGFVTKRSESKCEVVRSGKVYLQKLFRSMTARAALGILLQIVQNTPSYIQNAWPAVWFTLGVLRDCALLPAVMVVNGDKDLLPHLARQDFEEKMDTEINQNSVDAEQNVAPRRGIFVLLFGGGGRKTDPSKQEVLRAHPSSLRWDAGYVGTTQFISKNSQGGDIESKGVTVSYDDSNSEMLREINEADSIGDGGSDILVIMTNLRNIVASSGIAGLVSDTRFLSEETLLSALNALATLATEEEEESATNILEKGELLGTFVRRFGSILHGKSSRSTRSWFESLFVDASIRNRDRISIVWPVIENHYKFDPSTKTGLCYILERRVVGLFRIAERVMSRDNLPSPIVDLLRNMFLGQKNVDEEDGSDNEALKSTDTISIPSTSSLKSVVNDLSSQIATGLWRLLTKNVEALPGLTLEEWQDLFAIISVTANAGGYASIKAFETIAWLLHEPRLRAEVPVSCVVGIKPLLNHTGVPSCVSVGAIQLLFHLHTRLEVLVTAESNVLPLGEHDEGQESIWESCWAPILSALADGARDTRPDVRTSAVISLTKALADKHALVVPARVLVDILGTSVAPTILLLSEGLVAKLCAGSEHGSDDVLPKKRSDSLRKEEEIINETLGFANSPAKGEKDIESSLTPLLKKVLFAAPPKETDVGLSAKCLISLCDTFISHIDKLASYPSFDNLWIRMLHIFGYFLESPHGFKHSILNEDKSSSQLFKDQEELKHIVDIAAEYLELLIEALNSKEAFKSREGLWKLTKESVESFQKYSKKHFSK